MTSSNLGEPMRSADKTRLSVEVAKRDPLRLDGMPLPRPYMVFMPVRPKSDTLIAARNQQTLAPR